MQNTAKDEHPSPESIRARREAANLTRSQAADLIHSNEWRWRDWEAGKHKMLPGLWELFLLKLAQRAEANS